MKILFLDIETAPNLAYIWGLYRQNVTIKQIVDSSYTLCFTAKWKGDERIIQSSLATRSFRNMIREAHKLLDEADAVVGWNISKFDLPTLNKEFLLNGFRPPSPYKTIDLLKVSRQRFRFPSHKLDYVAQALNVGKKRNDDISMDTWKECMKSRKSPEWEKMLAYNAQDVLLVEAIYDKLLPWLTNHLSYSAYHDSLVCPNCGSHKYQARGWYYTKSKRYKRLLCTSCGTWFRHSLENDSSPKSRGIVAVP